MDNRPTLSICIPIYNRRSYLERMLSRFLVDKQLFEEKIQLFISDNCSTEDIKGVCDGFLSDGLELSYSCNAENLGMDGNFANCFNHAKGKYCWVLGSDDIPAHGLLENLLQVLEAGEYGLVHLSMKHRNKCLQVFDNHNEMLQEVGPWITFLSGNIIKTDTLKNIDLNQYNGTFITQVPAYLNACFESTSSVILYQNKFFLGDNDSKNNGGYNLFEVFVENLFGMYQQFIDKGMLSQKAFELIKEREYKTWLVGFVVDLLILKRSRRKNFKLDNAWGILRKHYGGRKYFYYSTIFHLCKMLAMSFARPVYHFLKRR